MDPFFQFPLTVPPEAIDANGHANNVEYIRWMQQAAIAHATAIGLTAATSTSGSSWVVHSHHIEYLKPVFLGEALVVKTWIVDAQRASSLRRYVFLRGDMKVASGETNWVFIDSRTGRPKTIPEEISSLLSRVKAP